MSSPVNLLAPDGSPVNADPEHVDSLLADGYKLVPDAAPGPVPAMQPDSPPAGLGDVVNLFAPDGSAVNADAQHVESLLADGYTLATPEAMAKRQEEQEYGDLGSQLAAGAEGVAQGATLGAYGAVAGLADESYDRERRLREQYNPVTSMAGQLVGTVAPAMLSGGTGAVGAVARALPAGIEANLGAKLAAHLGEKAAVWGAGRLGAVGARVVATGLESAADQAVRTVLDDAANGDVDVTAERMLDAAWHGMAAGAGLELGMAGVGALGRVTAAGARKAAGALGEAVGSAEDVAGSLAYKAAVGRTSIASQRLAARHGGGAEIGKTLLERGIVQAGDTVDDIAARLPAARAEAGAELGALIDQVGDATTSRADVLGRIQREVLDPLDVPGKKDIAEAVRRKLEASGLLETLAQDGGEIPLRDLHALRRAFDERPDLKWGAAGPNAPDITTEAMRDVRRVIEHSFEDASARAAESAGIAGYAKQLKDAKKTYAHLALAADQAEEGAMSRAGRNMFGLNDVLAGVAGAASMGPAGFAASVASKLARERFDATAARMLYRSGRRGADQASSLVGRFADGAIETQKSITDAAEATVTHLFSPERKRVVRTAALLGGSNAVGRAMERAVALQDPHSRESQAMEASLEQIGKTDAGLAQALGAKMRERASFIASKIPPAIDPSDPMGKAPGQMDATTARKSHRYVVAALDPQAALRRLASGMGSPEDLETLQALTPRLYQQYVQGVRDRVAKQKRAPTLRERRKLDYLLQMPMSRFSQPDHVAWLQAVQAPATQQQTSPNLAPATPKSKVNTDLDPRDNVYASRTDEIMAGR